MREDSKEAKNKCSKHEEREVYWLNVIQLCACKIGSL